MAELKVGTVVKYTGKIVSALGFVSQSPDKSPYIKIGNNYTIIEMHDRHVFVFINELGSKGGAQLTDGFEIVEQ